MERAQQAQAGDGEEIRRAPRRIEGETRLRRPGAIAARRQPDTRREPLLVQRPPPWLLAQVRLLAVDVSRSRVEWINCWCDEGELVMIDSSSSSSSLAQSNRG